MSDDIIVRLTMRDDAGLSRVIDVDVNDEPCLSITGIRVMRDKVDDRSFGYMHDGNCFADKCNLMKYASRLVIEKISNTNWSE